MPSAPRRRSQAAKVLESIEPPCAVVCDTRGVLAPRKLYGVCGTRSEMKAIVTDTHLHGRGNTT